MATPDPSRVCDLHCSSRQCWIHNALSRARDGTQSPHGYQSGSLPLSHNRNSSGGSLISGSFYLCVPGTFLFLPVLVPKGSLCSPGPRWGWCWVGPPCPLAGVALTLEENVDGGEGPQRRLSMAGRGSRAPPSLNGVLVCSLERLVPLTRTPEPCPQRLLRAHFFDCRGLLGSAWRCQHV